LANRSRRSGIVSTMRIPGKGISTAAKKALPLALVILFACSLPGQMVTPSKLKFEAASIKPASGFGECVSRDPGRFNCKLSLKDMIFLSWEVPAYQRLDPALVRASRGYEQVYEVVASVPKEAAANWGRPPKSNFAELHAMFRNLLIERFKLAYHYEKKEVQGYSLTVDKSGFKAKI